MRRLRRGGRDAACDSSYAPGLVHHRWVCNAGEVISMKRASAHVVLRKDVNCH